MESPMVGRVLSIHSNTFSGGLEKITILTSFLVLCHIAIDDNGSV
jgi:hypothetical protein